MKAIVIGATGATGKELIKGLVNDPEVTEIVALVRRPVKADTPGLKYEVVDFKHPQSWAPQVNGDVAFSCLGTTLKDAGSQDAQYEVDFGYQYEFAKAARENGVPSFILVSSMSADSSSKMFYPRIKGELEDRIGELGFDKLVIFRPGPLVRPDSDRWMERAALPVIKFLNKLGVMNRYAPLGVDLLARLMIRYSHSTENDKLIIESPRILREVGEG